MTSNESPSESVQQVAREDLALSSERQERGLIVFTLVEEGLVEIDSKYGPDSPNPLPYHNAEHTRDVIDAAIQLADRAIANKKITKNEKDLLILAACYHDWEHGLGSGFSEAESARTICHKMRDYKFSDEEVARVYKMIMATEVTFVDGRMHQSASDIAIDSGDVLTQLMADADLASLGKTSRFYWDRAMRLFAEVSKSTCPNQNEIIAFSLAQEDFIFDHKFYTEEANELFPYRETNIQFTKYMQQYYARNVSATIT